MPDGFWLSLSIIAAVCVCVIAHLEERYGWARKIMDFMFGEKEKD